MIGRTAELALLQGMIAEAGGGRGNALVLLGEAGIGKSALLDELAQRAPGALVLRATGVEAEAELPFAALHLLLRPARHLIDGLPAAQRDALRAAFGEIPRTGQDRFLVGMAVLTLLAELAEERLVLCLVDDGHWLDRASIEALAFAARRLDADRITMILAMRDDGTEPPALGLAELRLSGLDQATCVALLAEMAADLPTDARDRLIEEAEGNPLALIEFARALSAEQRAGPVMPYALQPSRMPMTGRLEQSLRAGIRQLPQRTRELLAVAAAEDSGDLDLVLRAAVAFGGDLADLEPAERGRLIQVANGRLRFRHPLVKTAAYREAPAAWRVAAHRALALAIEGDDDEQADRRAWHRSAAALGPDEETSGVVGMAGDRARARGSYPSAAWAYERAAQLTVDRERRAGWLVAAADMALRAGQLDRAGATADRGRRLAGDPKLRARLVGVRALVDYEHGTDQAASALIDAATDLGSSAPTEAASLLATAASAAWFAGDHEALRRAAHLLETLRSRIGPELGTVAGAVRGMERMIARRPDEGIPLLRAAIPADRATVTDQVTGTYAVFSALMTGDDEAAGQLAAAWVHTCRERGLLGALPHALQLLTQAEILRGHNAEAAACGAEAWRMAQDTGQAGRLRQLHGVLARLAAIEGDDERCHDLAERAAGAVQERNGSGWGGCALGLLDLARARHQALIERMSRILDGPLGHTVIVTFANADFVEACVRLGEPDRATGPFGRFEAWARASGQPWAEAVTHRCRALLSAPERAEPHYVAALEHHARGGRAFEHARTRLLYGEWLRRARRRADAREQLRTAGELFGSVGAAPWAERARTELIATGAPADTLRTDRPANRLSGLTPQELQVVRLAATGATNRQIAAQLFLSPRTVGFHLYKAYPKLGVASRADLSEIDFGVIAAR